MKRRLISAVGTLSVVCALVLVAGVIRPRGASIEGQSRALAIPEVMGEPSPLRAPPAPFELANLQPATADPLLEQISASSEELIPGFINAIDAHPILTSWTDLYEAESRVIYQSSEGSRWITLTAARVDCEDVDQVLEEFADPQVGRAEACTRWLEETRSILARHGMWDRYEREFLRELAIDTSVRVMLIYAGWQRDAESAVDDLDGIRLVHAQVAPVYPQSEFGRTRRLALNQVMRALRLGPYAEEPMADTVAMLLSW